jgi:hypothetical protein
MGIAYNTSTVRDGLVLHLDAANVKSYPGSGTVWTDMSGNDNNGTLINGVGYTSDNRGALTFDGVDDIVNGLHNSTLDIIDNLTINCWFKVTGARSDWVRISGKGDATNRTYGLWYNQLTSTFLYQRYGSSNMSITFSSTVQLNKWYYIAGTSSGTLHTLFLDSVPVTTGTSGSTFFASTSPFTVGKHPTIHTFHLGLVGSTMVYNRALTAAEIAQNFEAHRGRYGI